MNIALVGRYRFDAEIGSGAQGSVIKAYDTTLERSVALKKLNTLNSKIDDRKVLLREAKTLAQLRHPNIVTLYDFVEHEGDVFLAMEHIQGDMLSSRLVNGTLPIALFQKIAEQLSSAVEAAHDLGISHGDIKPANIMLDECDTARLIDFGLAKFSDRDDLLATVTTGAEITTSLAGTLPYMAPEVIMGNASDKRADIFSLGAVFYEMLSGQRAFQSSSHGEVLQNVLNYTPPSLMKTRPEIPPALALLVDRMLAKDPKARFQSMGDVYAGLVAVRGKGGAMEVLRVRLTHWVRVLLRRRQTPHWANVAAGAAAFGIVAWAGLVVTRDVAPPVSVRMERGVELVRHFDKKGAVKEAQDIFGRILSDDSEHAAAQAGLALALIREYTSMETDPATLRRASAYAEAALKADPHLALANVAAGWTAEFNSDFERAHQLYDAAEVLDPKNPLVFEGRARTLKKQGDYDGALEVLEKAVKTYPDSRVFYDDIGNLFSRKGNYKKAEGAYRSSIEVAPDNPRAYASLSHELHMQGRTNEAIGVIQDGLSIRENSELYNNLGAYLFFQGQYAQAVQAFERTLEFEGNAHDYFYWANLADAYRWAPGRQNDATLAYRRAMQLLQKDIDRRPNHPGLHSRMALYASKAGDKALAENSLEIAIRPPVAQPIIFYRAAVTSENLNNRDNALKMLSHAIEAGYPLNEIANDPELAQLRQDKNYQQLLTREGMNHG